jgi:hypothetical protein
VALWDALYSADSERVEEFMIKSYWENFAKGAPDASEFTKAQTEDYLDIVSQIPDIQKILTSVKAKTQSRKA